MMMHLHLLLWMPLSANAFVIIEPSLSLSSSSSSSSKRVAIQQPFRTTTSTTTVVVLKSTPESKWEQLQDDDLDDSDLPPVKADMKYNSRNALRQNAHYVAIREACGLENKELVNDLYMRAVHTGVPQDETTFWFVGKVARISDVSLEACVARQWNLIEMHAANLRPIELFPYRNGRLEIWTAPGDSELDVAYHRPTVEFQKQSRNPVDFGMTQAELDKIKNSFIGFQGEVYDRGEEGFRILRATDGKTARPEITNPVAEEDDDDDDDGSDYRAPSEEELEKIQKALEGRDINQLYEDQQKREGKGEEEN